MGKKIFVGGLMKSGTSLVRILICQNETVFGGPETHWFDESFSYQSGGQIGDRLALFLKFYDLDAKTLRECVEDETNQRLALLSPLLSHLAKQDNKDNWAEKTPANFKHVEEILSCSEEARFIFVDRDPRDIFASWKTNAKGSLSDFLRERKQFLSLYDAYKDNARVTKVTYEDVVKHPQSSLNALMNFLGIQKQSVEGFSGEPTLKLKVEAVTGRESPTANNAAKPIFQTSIGGWKSVLDKDEVDAILGSENETLA